MTSLPAVFAVGDQYQIMFYVAPSTMAWVKIGDTCYYDNSNGIIRSEREIRRVTVPMAALDAAKQYTVCTQSIERKVYFSELGEVVEHEFSFQPLPDSHIRAFQIADAHNEIERPTKSAKAAGAFDLLIFNGDIPIDCGKYENFRTIYDLAGEVTGGKLPIVFTRGNHDLRGLYAEQLEYFSPSLDGRTYYSVRMGSLWILVLDCGEDKPDDHKEYANTICCHAFRQTETAFLQKIVERADEEYLAPGITHRIVLTHIPFTYPTGEAERETYRAWVQILREHVRPDVIICGHTHRLNIVRPGDQLDAFGQPCPLVEATSRNEEAFAGTLFTFEDREIKLRSFDDSAACVAEQTLPLA